MKIRHKRKKIKCKKFIYFLGRVIIKSDIKLTKIMKKRIRDIIKDNTTYPYYGYDYTITKTIFYLCGKNVAGVYFVHNRIFFFVKIDKKADTDL